METPTSETTRVSWSTRRSRFTAESTPSGIPTRMLRLMATTASSIVAGKVCRRSSQTGWRVEMDTPKFPRTRFQR